MRFIRGDSNTSDVLAVQVIHCYVINFILSD